MTTTVPSFADLIGSRWIKPDLQSLGLGAAIRELTMLLRTHPAVRDAVRLELDVARCLQRNPVTLLPELMFFHVRTSAVADFVIAAGRSPRGIVLDGRNPPVQLVVVLASPDSQISGHLALLARLARHLTQPNILERLIAADDRARFEQVLRQEE